MHTILTVGFKFVLVAIVIGALTYQNPIYIGNNIYARSRAVLDTVHEATRGIIYGNKEVQLNRSRKDHYFGEILLKNENELLRADQSAATTFVVAASYCDLICFLVIGMITFVFVNYHSVSPEALVGVVMALLYISGPVAASTSAIPRIAIARRSYENIQRIFGEIPQEADAAGDLSTLSWRTMTFSQITYRHKHGAPGKCFSVGPLDLTINKGEVLFIVGGNGSGKSTLGKIVSLLYPMTTGAVSLDGRVLEQASLESFRQNIAAIFTDYFLFDRLLCKLDAKQEVLLSFYLSEFGLQDKVSVQDGKFSTLALSDGQRKRLALLVALLDDKELYVFDEWAADQDPVYKKLFYSRILPELRARNKAVVVISHDDAFFDAADRLIVMADGHIVNSPPTLAESIELADMVRGAGVV